MDRFPAPAGGARLPGVSEGDGYAGHGAMLCEEQGGDPLVPEERRLGCGLEKAGF